MTHELTALTLAALVQVAQFVLFAVPANSDLTVDYTLSPRDSAPPKPLSKTTARLGRALNNHFDALILFTIAVCVVTLGEKSSPLTVACGWAYLAARVLYVPAYAFGWRPWRSVIWTVGFLATTVMLVAALL